MKTHGLPAGVDIALVSTRVERVTGQLPTVRVAAREGVGNLPVIADDGDSTAYFAYGAGGLPYIVYLDKDNKVALRTEGEYGNDPEVFTAVVREPRGGPADQRPTAQ